MQDVRVGSLFRAVRISLRWRQVDVALRAGVSPSLVSSMERGGIDLVSLRTLRRVADTLGIRMDVVARWRGGDGDRLLDSAHAALQESVARYLGRSPGWEHGAEVTYSVYGERGVIDILCFHESSGSLLVIELKTEVASLQDLVGSMDRRVRLARGIARERGWLASSVSAWVIIAESQANRRRVKAHQATLRSAFPQNGRAMRAWMRHPLGPISSLSFWSNFDPDAVRQRIAPVLRVRAA